MLWFKKGRVGGESRNSAAASNRPKQTKLFLLRRERPEATGFFSVMKVGRKGKQ